MGKALSIFTRPVRTFNIENRAQRIISRDKPVPAPQHESVEKQKKMADELNPKFMEQHYKKNVGLDERLRSVYVIADENKTLEDSENSVSTRPLPEKRYRRTPFEFGIFEPQTVAEGKCSLKQALNILSKHKSDPIEHSVSKLAVEYKMDKQVLKNIIFHYKLPVLHNPYTTELMKKFASKK